jgi:signal transduction protein with GAF and PtsI domain
VHHRAKPANIKVRSDDTVNVVARVCRLHVTEADFDRLWTLAATQSLTHARFVSTMPRYGGGLVTSVAFSNEPIE